MGEVIEDEQSLEYDEETDSYVYTHSIKERLTPEQFEKNIKFLNNNIETLRLDIVRHEKSDDIEHKKQQLLNEYEVKKEAIKNWDAYYAKKIREIKLEKHKQYLLTREYLKNFDENFKKAVERFKENSERQCEHSRNQLKQDEQSRELYRQAELQAGREPEEPKTLDELRAAYDEHIEEARKYAKQLEERSSGSSTA